MEKWRLFALVVEMRLKLECQTFKLTYVKLGHASAHTVPGTMQKTLEFCQKNDIACVSDGNAFWYRASDIGRLLKLKRVNSSLTSFPKVERRLMRAATKGGPQMAMMLSTNGLKRFLCHSRSLHATTLARELGIDVLSNRIVPKETETLSFLRKVFGGEVDMEFQYQCGKYKIDMYLPEYKLAVECDEDGTHTPSTALKDFERERWLKSELGCSFIRYRPDEPDFDIAEVAGKVFQKVMQKRSHPPEPREVGKENSLNV